MYVLRTAQFNVLFLLLKEARSEWQWSEHMASHPHACVISRDSPVCSVAPALFVIYIPVAASQHTKSQLSRDSASSGEVSLTVSRAILTNKH